MVLCLAAVLLNDNACYCSIINYEFHRAVILLEVKPTGNEELFHIIGYIITHGTVLTILNLNPVAGKYHVKQYQESFKNKKRSCLIPEIGDDEIIKDYQLLFFFSHPVIRWNKSINGIYIDYSFFSWLIITIYTLIKTIQHEKFTKNW